MHIKESHYVHLSLPILSNKLHLNINTSIFFHLYTILCWDIWYSIHIKESPESHLPWWMLYQYISNSSYLNNVHRFGLTVEPATNNHPNGNKSVVSMKKKKKTEEEEHITQHSNFKEIQFQGKLPYPQLSNGTDWCSNLCFTGENRRAVANKQSAEHSPTSVV